ncbi:MAG: DNA replication and repair protein RecF [Bacteroidales bacterium]|nr:DNA replication and repair protein RecF [Bacteroidales bacterium]
MHLKNLNILNFKNLEEVNINLSKKLNCFTGKNGAGKTNLLDAIYYLSFTKSYFNTSDSMNLNINSNFFVIRGKYKRKDKKEDIYCGYTKEKKKTFKRNDKAYKKFSEHIGLIPIVMVSPDDIILISGSSEERRKYIDSVISQYDKEYLHVLIKYNKVIQQRNRLLKNYSQSGYFDKDTISIYNSQLTEYGTLIYNKRHHFILELQTVFTKYYEIISKNNETVELNYQSHLNNSELLELLEASIEKDKILGYTTKGIHRDDLNFGINSFSLRKAGSQGQQKTFLISLKFAQYEFIKEISKISPLLLLDDVFDKFDAERVEEIIKLTSNNNFGQIFISDTNPERVKKVIDKEKGNYKLFSVEKGKITDITD